MNAITYIRSRIRAAIDLFLYGSYARELTGAERDKALLRFKDGAQHGQEAQRP